MSKYLMRLDDASDYMDVEKWNRMENLLDSYHVKPLVGVIPNNQDPSLVQIYPKDMKFWDKVRSYGANLLVFPYKNNAKKFSMA